MSGWGGSRAGAGRKRKTLLERVRSESFKSDRHAYLLEVDDSLVVALEGLAPDDPDRAWFAELVRLQRAYRLHRTQLRRREILGEIRAALRDRSEGLSPIAPRAAAARPRPPARNRERVTDLESAASAPTSVYDEREVIAI